MRYLALGVLLAVLFTQSCQAGVDTLPAHWDRPVDLGDTKAQGFGPYPEKCGACHVERHREWTGSLHGKSVGPGLLGQLDHDADPGMSSSCYYCHAPSVQQTEVVESGKGQAGAFIANPAFDPVLKLSGVSCAVCHVRGGKVNGPGKGKSPAGDAESVHGSARNAFFREAEFCAACHQLDQGYELNGKLIINTYREWKASAYAESRVVCQDCHMPGQRHLFRGIHDPEMTRSGISVEVSQERAGDGMSARLTLTNSGTGHYFPTYATPIVAVRGFVAANGSVVPGSLKESYVGRMLSLDLSEEIYDTRIPPFGKFEFDYGGKINAGSEKLVFEVWVYPDDFYARFYRSLLAGEGRIDRAQIEQALGMAEASKYLLFRKEMGYESDVSVRDGTTGGREGG